MKLTLENSTSSSCYVIVNENAESINWHNRLGHIGKKE